MKFITSMTMVDQIIGSAPFVYEGDFAQGVAKARELGYDGVELHIADPADVDLPTLEQALAENSMRLTAIGTGRAYVNHGLSITDPDEARRRAAVQRLEAFLELAGRLHATVIIGCMRGNVATAEELPAALDRLAVSMEYLDHAAAKAGVDIVFEPINRYENNFLCTMGEISHFIRSHSLTNTGILIDTFHMNIEESDMMASIEACSPEIRYVHFSDSNRWYPGAGHTDMAGILRKLQECDYQGVLSAEILPKPLYIFFIVGGAMFALATTLNSQIMSATKPIMQACEDGWFPKSLAELSRYKTPWKIMLIFYIVLVVPILLDLEIAQISSLVQILGYINNLVLTTTAMKLPKMFPEAWEKSQFRVPIPVFYALMVITCIAILIQASFMLSSMNIKLILFNAATMAFGFFWAFYRYGSGKAKPTVSYEMA